MKIKIGVSEYNLQMVGGQELMDEYGYDVENVSEIGGSVHPLMERIRINKDLPKSVKQKSFMHEVVHAFMDEIGSDDLYSDEGFVDALSKQMYGFLKNNNLEKIYAYLGC